MWNAVPWAFIKLHKHLLSTQSLPGAILRTKDAETKMYISSGPLTGAQRKLGKLRCEQVATGRHEPPQVSVCRSGGHTDKDLQTPPRKKRWRLKFSRMTKSIVLGEGRAEITWWRDLSRFHNISQRTAQEEHRAKCGTNRGEVVRTSCLLLLRVYGFFSSLRLNTCEMCSDYLYFQLIFFSLLLLL